MGSLDRGYDVNAFKTLSLSETKPFISLSGLRQEIIFQDAKSFHFPSVATETSLEKR